MVAVSLNVFDSGNIVGIIACMYYLWTDWDSDVVCVV